MPDWSRPPLHPIVSPGVMRLESLADVRSLIERQLPAEYRDNAPWRHVADELKSAASGADVRNVSIALRMALMLGGVEHK